MPPGLNSHRSNNLIFLVITNGTFRSLIAVVVDCFFDDSAKMVSSFETNLSEVEAKCPVSFDEIYFDSCEAVFIV